MGVIERSGESGSGTAAPEIGGDSSIRILLVDDHDDTLQVIGAILRQRGFEVLPAGSVAEAHAQAAGGFDLLLSDIDLPDGTGIELIESLSRERSVRGIAMSGFGSTEDIAQSIAAGFMRHLVKPFTADRLFEAVALALLEDG